MTYALLVHKDLNSPTRMPVTCRCRKACMNNKDCNAVTWRNSKKECTMRKLKDGHKGYIRVAGYSSFVFCDGMRP